MELVLNTFGVSLNRDNEAFIVASQEGKQRIPADNVSSIQVCRGASITSDAILLAIEHEIEVLFLGKSGDPQGRVWSNKYGSISTIRKGQLNFTFSPEAVTWIKDVIRQKMENQQALLLTLQATNTTHQLAINKAIQRIEDYRSKVKALQADVVADIASPLRGWEGQASKIYFEALNHFIPNEYQFTKRSQHPAMDVVNAFLNYGYGMLYGKIEGQLIKAGIDPYVGVFHRDDYNRPVLVYDVIELYRIWIDYVVYTLVAQNCITEEYYSINTDGSFWLETLGRRVIIQSVNDYLDEVITIAGVSRSRETHMMLKAQQLAQMFKSFL